MAYGGVAVVALCPLHHRDGDPTPLELAEKPGYSTSVYNHGALGAPALKSGTQSHNQWMFIALCISESSSKKFTALDSIFKDLFLYHES